MKHFFIFFIKLYQKILSPYTRPCRLIPSCSEYAKEAFFKYGAIKGGILAFLRILRCNPFAKRLYDPVP